MRVSWPKRSTYLRPKMSDILPAIANATVPPSVQPEDIHAELTVVPCMSTAMTEITGKIVRIEKANAGWKVKPRKKTAAQVLSARVRL